MEVTMRKLIVAVAVICGAALFGASLGLAAGAGNYAKLPGAMQALKPGVELVGYKHCDYSGCYYCQYRECEDYYRCGYYKKCCSSYRYYDCAPYGGGGYGGGYRKRYQGGGGY
jgi:hypothetical protein